MGGGGKNVIKQANAVEQKIEMPSEIDLRCKNKRMELLVLIGKREKIHFDIK